MREDDGRNKRVGLKGKEKGGRKRGDGGKKEEEEGTQSGGK